MKLKDMNIADLKATYETIKTNQDRMWYYANQLDNIEKAIKQKIDKIEFPDAL